MNTSNPNGSNPDINLNQDNTNQQMNNLSTTNTNNSNTSVTSSQTESVRVSSQSNQFPLSSSLPNNLSNSGSTNNRFLNNIISLSSLASSSSSSSSTVSNNYNSEKMDTSFITSEQTSSNLNPSNRTDSGGIQVGDIIARLYPNVNQNETPLPRRWISDQKSQSLAISHDNQRVTYKGAGKSHRDAASVRTDFPIPVLCGIYYFEVKIISKGRDGFMGIGLSKSDVSLNRLPGWDKNSYGYHGDDGHSFCCSGTGQNYGPTFTTGDIIGCCLNLIENFCFYTKNGYNLGVAFRDLPVF